MEFCTDNDSSGFVGDRDCRRFSLFGAILTISILSNFC